MRTSQLNDLTFTCLERSQSYLRKTKLVLNFLIVRYFESDIRNKQIIMVHIEVMHFQEILDWLRRFLKPKFILQDCLKKSFLHLIFGIFTLVIYSFLQCVFEELTMFECIEQGKLYKNAGTHT